MLDLYSNGAYQGVTAGGLKTGGAFVQNTALSINLDTPRAGLWPGGLLHVTLESRFGSSPQSTFTVCSSVPHYYGLAVSGPLPTTDVFPAVYCFFPSFGPHFALLL